MATRAAARARRSTWTTSSRASCASASCRCSKRCRSRRKCGAATSLLKTRPRDVEETLLQLINDEDQVVAAAAIDTARAHKIWALADDIEHVLAHRDVARLVRLRGRVVGARRETDAGGTPSRAVARAAAGRGAGDPPARAAALRVPQHRRAVPHRLDRAPGPSRPGQRPARGRRSARDVPLPARRPRRRVEPRRRAASRSSRPRPSGSPKRSRECRCPRRCAPTAWR